MHARERNVVTDEVDEAVARGAAGELVLDHLDGEDVGLPHGMHRLQYKVLVHVGLQTSDP